MRSGKNNIGIWVAWYSSFLFSLNDNVKLKQATVAMSLLLVFSSIYVRQRAYEVFLLIHIALSIVTIVGLF